MIGLFIDGSYLRKAWRATSNEMLAYDALRPLTERLCNDAISVAYYYDAVIPGQDRSRETAAWMHAGFRVKCDYRVTTETLKDSCGRVILDPNTRKPLTIQRQKGVDIGLALRIDRSQVNDGWNHLVLVAGDADFVELVQELVERRDVVVTLVGHSASTSIALRSYSQRMIDLREIADDLILPSRELPLRTTALRIAAHNRHALTRPSIS
jgi:uncharacterized LabA/DUF88 family protein